jgi:hypothetical protein
VYLIPIYYRLFEATMETDKTEEDLRQEQIEKVALLITNSLVQVILDDDFEDTVPEHTLIRLHF